jgi:hypothetical protein
VKRSTSYEHAQLNSDTLSAAIGSLLVPFGMMRAQTDRAVYQIPFSFNAEGAKLSSGKYILSSRGPQSGMLRGEDGKGVLFYHLWNAKRQGPSCSLDLQ